MSNLPDRTNYLVILQIHVYNCNSKCPIFAVKTLYASKNQIGQKYVGIMVFYVVRTNSLVLERYFAE